MLQTLKRLERSSTAGDGALQAYLRQAVMNRIRNELRKRAMRGANHHPGLALRTTPLRRSKRPSPGNAGPIRRRAPAAQTRGARGGVSRVEFDLSYAELAEVLGKPSPDAARMTVVRALVRLAEEMRRG